jgi:hypothetical protein
VASARDAIDRMTKSATPVEIALATPFRLESIAPVGAPDGGQGPWQRYVITQGKNTITGVRAGTREEVGERLADMVACLNERRLGKHAPKSKGAGPRPSRRP